MTYAEIAKERDDLKSENETLRAIMDKMLEKGKALEAENLELKARLEKAVELPVKVGDTIYVLTRTNEDLQKVYIFAEGLYNSMRVYPHTVRKIEVDFLRWYCYIEENPFPDNFRHRFYKEEFGNIVFTDLEAAEARLKELQGGKR